MADDGGCDEATAIAERVQSWEGRPRTIQPLVGGLTNRNFLVRVEEPEQRAVIRLPGKDTHLLGIDRATELAAASHAADRGWAPAVIDYVDPPGCLVTEFVDASSPPNFADPVTVAKVASLLRRVHAGPPLPTNFKAFAIARTYAQTAFARGVTLPPVLDRALAIAERIERSFASRPEPDVPAHNDLLGANFLCDPDGPILLIDWEYAGMGSRWFDLGNVAANNGLDSDQRAVLLRAYAGSVTSGGVARIELMMVMSDLREAMWAVVQQGISTIEFDYVEYAGRHFDRLLGNGTTDAFELALEKADQI